MGPSLDDRGDRDAHSHLAIIPIYSLCNSWHHPTNRHLTVSAIADIATWTAITEPFSTRFEFDILLPIIFDVALSSYCSNFGELPSLSASFLLFSFLFFLPNYLFYLTFGSRHIAVAALLASDVKWKMSF